MGEEKAGNGRGGEKKESGVENGADRSVDLMGKEACKLYSRLSNSM